MRLGRFQNGPAPISGRTVTQRTLSCTSAAPGDPVAEPRRQRRRRPPPLVLCVWLPPPSLFSSLPLPLSLRFTLKFAACLKQGLFSDLCVSQNIEMAAPQAGQDAIAAGKAPGGAPKERCGAVLAVDREGAARAVTEKQLGQTD